MAGANIGASVGTTASGIHTQDPNQIIQGGVSLATNIGDAMTLPAKKNAMMNLAEVGGSMDKNQLAQANMILGTGDYDAFNKFLEGIGTTFVAPNQSNPTSFEYETDMLDITKG
jgi:hypothetical protein